MGSNILTVYIQGKIPTHFVPDEDSYILSEMDWSGMTFPLEGKTVHCTSEYGYEDDFITDSDGSLIDYDYYDFGEIISISFDGDDEYEDCSYPSKFRTDLKVESVIIKLFDEYGNYLDNKTIHLIVDGGTPYDEITHNGVIWLPIYPKELYMVFDGDSDYYGCSYYVHYG